MSDLNQFSLEDDEYNNIFITQESWEDGNLVYKQEKEAMDTSELGRSIAENDKSVGTEPMYSDISDDEAFEPNDSGVK